MRQASDLIDYLSQEPKCRVIARHSGHAHIQCGECEVVIPVMEPLTTVTLNQIEYRLERCLGFGWCPFS